ncbi:hypothetical protein SAMN05444354_12767 [Stigmatella aurantiaca]|uniref:Uncharacterized protein n=1 Tax=Stigmatella aurantiaca TaxID=41 RepID=A0A1H8CTA7_STIAU|nr:DUF1302 family protein [Stigmatella aurantiaca]SEM98109.1 hypothetical protein SAMN05444354_12767 [Stigmatella aurantiaca]
MGWKQVRGGGLVALLMLAPGSVGAAQQEEAPLAGDAESPAPAAEEASSPADASGGLDTSGDSFGEASLEGFASESQASTELLGWARLSPTYDFPRSGPTGEPPELRTPHDRLTERSTLYLRFHHRRGDGWSFAASGALDHRVRWRKQTPPAGQEAGDSWRTQLEPRLQELYLGLSGASLSVTLGQQRIAWGRNEVLAINDVVNPQDLRDPLLVPEELRYKPVIAARVDLSLGSSSLQLIAVPFFQPASFDFYGSNWALVQDAAPAAYRAVLGQLGDSSQGSALFSPERGVSAGLTQAAAGLRFSWRLGGVEINHYYHLGFDSTPRWRVDEAQLAALLDPALQEDPAARALAFNRFAETVSVSYQRRHHVGFSAVGEAGPFILYGEGAYDSRKVFITQALSTAVHPFLTALAGIEYQRDFDQVVDFALSYGRILPREGQPPPLLWNERDSLGSALTVRWGLTEEFSLEGQGGVGFIPLGVSGRLGVRWKREHLSCTVGALLLAGETFSYGGYYRANQGLYADLRYVF